MNSAILYDGQSIVLECRAAQGQYEALPALVEALVHLPVDVIFTPQHPGALAAQHDTQTISIVMVVTGDPVATGLVTSLAHSGGD